MKTNIAIEYIYSTFELLGATLVTPFIPLIALWVGWNYTVSDYIMECRNGFRIIWGIDNKNKLIPKDGKMPMTSEQFYIIAERDQETILEQRLLIGSLRSKINKLEQKVKK